MLFPPPAGIINLISEKVYLVWKYFLKNVILKIIFQHTLSLSFADDQ